MDIKRTQSPTNETQSDINPLKSKLKKVFEYYCQYGERFNTNIMKSNKFMKIAKDSGVIDNFVNRTRLELIYKSENKFNRMNFREFLNSLIKIAEFKYTKGNCYITAQLDRKNMLNLLLTSHFIPLHDMIFSVSSEAKQENVQCTCENVNVSNIIQVPNIQTEICDGIVEEVFTSVAPILFEIYGVYFSHETSLSDDIDYIKDTSFKQYFLFLRDFDISPGLISKPAAFQIYQSESVSEVDESLNNNKNYYFRLIRGIDLISIIKYNPKNQNILGQYFNFFKLLRVILKIADFGYQKLDLPGDSEINTNTVSIPIHERLILLLERMQISEGFLKLEIKTSKTHSSKTSTMIKRDLLEKMQKSGNSYGNSGYNYNSNTALSNNINSSNINVASGTEGKENQNTITNSQLLSYHNNYMELCEYSQYIVENYGQNLMYIFKGLCQFGDPLNSKYMKTKIFTKFLVEAKLVRMNTINRSMNNRVGLKMNDIDTIFIKLSNLNMYSEPDVNNLHISSSNHNLLQSQTRNKSASNLFQQNNSSSTNLLCPNAQSFSKSNFDPILNLKKRAPINSNAKIEFSGFIIAIEVISKLVYPNMSPKDAIDKIIKDHILKNLAQNYLVKVKALDAKIEYLKERQNSEEFVYVLGIVHKAMTPVFKYYSKNEMMNFSQFMQFAADFSIFPDMVAKCKLNSFFRSISQYSNYAENEVGNGNEVIEQSLFVDILALCAFELLFSDPEPSPLEKILCFMEKIAQSEGPGKILRESGSTRLTSGDSLNILDYLHAAFPQYFAIDEPKKREDFEELLSSK